MQSERERDERKWFVIDRRRKGSARNPSQAECLFN